jgi:hypothetical protein
MLNKLVKLQKKTLNNLYIYKWEMMKSGIQKYMNKNSLIKHLNNFH